MPSLVNWNAWQVRPWVALLLARPYGVFFAYMRQVWPAFGEAIEAIELYTFEDQRRSLNVYWLTRHSLWLDFVLRYASTSPVLLEHLFWISVYQEDSDEAQRIGAMLAQHPNITEKLWSLLERRFSEDLRKNPLYALRYFEDGTLSREKERLLTETPKPEEPSA